MVQAKAAEPNFSSNQPHENAELQIHVIYTGLNATKAALETAQNLATDLGTKIVLLIPEVVPYPLALDCPPVSSEQTEKTVWRLTHQQRVEIRATVYLCRDRDQAIRDALARNSLVILAARKRWWPTGPARLAGKLRKDGHQVILVDSRTIPLPDTSGNHEITSKNSHPRLVQSGKEKAT